MFKWECPHFSSQKASKASKILNSPKWKLCELFKVQPPGQNNPSNMETSQQYQALPLVNIPNIWTPTQNSPLKPPPPPSSSCHTDHLELRKILFTFFSNPPTNLHQTNSHLDTPPDRQWMTPQKPLKTTAHTKTWSLLPWWTKPPGAGLGWSGPDPWCQHPALPLLKMVKQAKQKKRWKCANVHSGTS